MMNSNMQTRYILTRNVKVGMMYLIMLSKDTEEKKFKQKKN